MTDLVFPIASTLLLAWAIWNGYLRKRPEGLIDRLSLRGTVRSVIVRFGWFLTAGSVAIIGISGMFLIWEFFARPPPADPWQTVATGYVIAAIGATFLVIGSDIIRTVPATRDSIAPQHED